MAQQTEIVSPSEYRTARLALLAKEKELTRAKDALAAERRKLPVVQIDKEYKFEGIDEHGNTKSMTLLDLFAGRRQLIIYHFMFNPAEETGCSSCSWYADNLPSNLSHLYSRNTSFAVISRAPIAKIAAFKKRMGWTFPWFSSNGSDFNYDYGVTLDAKVHEPVEYNFRSAAEYEAKGMTWFTRGEQPGMSAFLRDAEGNVFHTYSCYARGTDGVTGTADFLDLTKLGRQDRENAAPADTFHDDYTEEDLKGRF